MDFSLEIFQILEAIKKNADGKVLKQYLRASFALSKGQLPHKIAFLTTLGVFLLGKKY